MLVPPDISVIVTSYNVARYIARAIESALAQEGVTLEVIVVDDASTDGTWDVIESVTDARVKKIRLPGNGGPSVARNAGIEAASGAWIAVLDGDDQYLPGRLSRLFAKAREAQADIVVDNLEVMREEDGQQFPMFTDFATRKKLTLEDFIAGNLNFSRGYALGYLKPMISAAFLKEKDIRYQPDIRIGEDYLLMLELLASGAVCAVEPTAGYGYTVRAGSISHRLRIDDVERIRACDERFFNQYKVGAEAHRLQALRTANLEKTYAYTLMVDALKARQYDKFFALAWTVPSAALMLWQPVMVRLKRLG